MTLDLHPVAYGIYRIRLWRDGQMIAGRPFVGTKAVLPQQKAPSRAALLADIKGMLDARNAATRARRGAHGTPLPEEYAEALLYLDSQQALVAGRRRMLRALFDAPNRTLTATQLAEAAGYAHYGSANLQFGLLGQAVAMELGFDLPRRKDGSPIATMALADGPEEEPDGEWPWTLRPRVVDAIMLLPPGFLNG